MRTLSGTLLAAQRSDSARPYLRVRLFDRDVGVVRLNWQRWYEGAEPDGPCGAAVPADGSLLRARIDPGAGICYRQRVAGPDESRDYSGWTWLSAGVLPGPRLGLSAAGGRALIVIVTSGNFIESYDSDDSGSNYGTADLVVAAGGAVTAVTCALQSDGSAAVLYAVAGVVYSVTRSGTGSWGSPAAWTQSLASVSALAAYFENDYEVLVSGATSAGDEGVWSTMLGAGGMAPSGNWSPLAELALASSGTDVSYLATGAASADVPRALFVESYSGGGSYDRVHTAAGVSLSLWSDFLWRDPRPFERTSAYGLAVAAGAGDAWLCSPDGVWHAGIAVTVDELTDDVLEADMEQGLERGRLRLVLRNDDGRYNTGVAPAAFAPGGELLVGPGYETTAGAEASQGPRFWITALRRRRRGGSSTVEIEAVDGWGLLRAWTASRQLVWAADTVTAFQVLRDLTRRAGLTMFSVDASAEATTLKPAFTVRAGERGSTATSRLLAALPDVLVVSGVNATLTEPAPDAAVDYAYGADHAVLELRDEERDPATGWVRVFGNGVFAEALDGEALRRGASTTVTVDDNLTAQARADARASTLLRQSALAVPRGELIVAPNVGQEVADVVSVTDAVLGLSAARYRVAALRLRFLRGGTRPRYEMTLSLTEV